MVFFRVWIISIRIFALVWVEFTELFFFSWTTRCVQEGFAHPTELAGEGARAPRTSWDRALGARLISIAECSQSWASAAVQSVHHCLRKVLLRRYQQQQLIPLGLTKMLIKNSVFKGHIYLQLQYIFMSGYAEWFESVIELIVCLLNIFLSQSPWGFKNKN